MTKPFQIITIICFLAIIFVPNLAMITGWNTKIDYRENRILNPFPDFTNTKPEKIFEVIHLFYNDHFGFRNFMIGIKEQIEFRFFHVGPRNLFYGKGFYFLNPINVKNPKADYKTIFFTQEELIAIQNELEKESSWMKQRSIPFLLVIAPDKEAVYPEYFPYPNHILTNYKLDQLIAYLEKNSFVRLIDLRKALLNNKGEFMLYYRGDTHWNAYGAFLGYQEIIRHLSLIYPDIYVPQISDLEIKTENDEDITGDLTRLATLLQQPSDPEIKLMPKSNFPGEGKKLNKVYIYGDSYSTNIVDGEIFGLTSFLPLNFKQVNHREYITAMERSQQALSPLEYSEIEREKPDLVIRETVQRNLRIFLGPDYTTF